MWHEWIPARRPQHAMSGRGSEGIEDSAEAGAQASLGHGEHRLSACDLGSCRLFEDVRLNRLYGTCMG